MPKGIMLTPEQQEERREEIISVAMQLIEKNEFQKTSMRLLQVRRNSFLSPSLDISIMIYQIFVVTTLIISKKPGNTGISRDIRTEFTTDLLLSD